MAKRRNGNLFTLSEDREKEHFAKIRDKETFFCPACDAEVHMKLGDKRMWHFAHRNDAACSYSGESESRYHLSGKKQLFQWLQSRHPPVELEPYLPQIKQRPDLLLRTRPQPIVFEFQCSTISRQLFMKRTSSYENADYVPVWILGGNRMKRTKRDIFQLSELDWLALRKTKTTGERMLLYYCPDAGCFASLSQIVPFSPSKVHANVRFYQESLDSLSDLLDPPETNPFSVPTQWLNVKRQKRTYAFRERSRECFYLRKVAAGRPLFPPAVGWPTPSSISIETSPFIWQSWLFHQFLKHGDSSRVISLSSVRKAFHRLVFKGLFRLRSIPAIAISECDDAISEYMKCLVRFGLLEPVGFATFRLAEGTSLFTHEREESLEKEYFEKLFGIF
ncbi:MAG TPA: competence protein CoiA family protein [Bacillales bacterium]|nr:competence protein CoiA family protein [Bacillales bacterium]